LQEKGELTMDFMGNMFVKTAANYSVVVLCLVLFLAVFELVTRYKNWVEIKNGNLSVAMATGGKIFGIANIFRYSIAQNDSLLEMMIWGIFGFALLLIGYFIFEFLTPKFQIDKEIEKDNRAVGFISMVISIGLSFVIGAGIE
jgi:putative membrane protein